VCGHRVAGLQAWGAQPPGPAAAAFVMLLRACAGALEFESAPGPGCTQPAPKGSTKPGAARRLLETGSMQPRGWLIGAGGRRQA